MKKKKWNFVSVIMMLVLCMAMFAGCGSSSDSAAAESIPQEYVNGTGSSYAQDDLYMYDGATGVTEESMADEAPMAESGSAEGTQAANSDRKLITTMHISAETENFDEFISNLESRVTEVGGYVENSTVYEMYTELRAADYVIRVPEEYLDEFTGLVSEQSNVTYRSRQVDDVTLTYVDLESRKAVLMTEQDRLLEMLEQAGDIETILAIETRLSEVQCSIESMESQLRTFDNAISYSTIYLSVEEVVVYTVVQEEEKSAWQRMGEGFLNSLEKVGIGLCNFGINFVIAIPYLLVVAVVILIFFLIIRGIIKAVDRKAEEKKKIYNVEYKTQEAKAEEKNESAE